MRKSTSGFTIIEIIVVIVVLAILMAIVGSAYNMTQQQSRNAERYTEMKEWQRLLERYKARNGEYPDVPMPDHRNFCLGYGFPQGHNNERRCRDYVNPGGDEVDSDSYRQDRNTAFMEELKTVGKLPPEGPRRGLYGIVGPYVEFSVDGKYQIRNIFEGETAEDCPNGTTISYVFVGKPIIMCGLDDF